MRKIYTDISESINKLSKSKLKPFELNSVIAIENNQLHHTSHQMVQNAKNNLN